MIKDIKIAKRYARAMFDIASEDQSYDDWLNKLKLISDTRVEVNFANALNSTKLSFSKKTNLIDDVFSNKLNKLQLNLPEITINLSKIDSANLINETGKSIHLKCDIKNSKKILNQGIDTGSKLTIRNEKDSIGIYKGNSKIHIIDNSIAKRISNLINLGNEYTCTVLGVSENSININIKETSKSKKTMQIISFPEYLNSDLHKTSINQNIKNLNLVNVDEFD